MNAVERNQLEELRRGLEEAGPVNNNEAARKVRNVLLRQQPELAESFRLLNLDFDQELVKKD